MKVNLIKNSLSVSVLFALAGVTPVFAAEVSEENVVKLNTIVVTAEEQVKQSLGVSEITAEDLEKTPVVNDISEIVVRMPGVNLTANGSTGARGNQRQINIRGMGPENTLILVDGKPVNSRQSVRYGRGGDRDTRGDSNWVPADAIESIEVLRGPAAARYGSGAMGGVVNIITKKVTNDTHGSLEYFTNQPEDSKEGSSYRVGFNLSGPIINDVLGYRIYGNYNKTKADAVDLNSAADSVASGREGVENKDISARLAWNVTDNQTLTLDTSFGRQGNLYSGDSELMTDAEANATLAALLGSETNTMYRDSYALTHEGKWDWGTSKISAQYDQTKNKRLNEGLAGGSTGAINTTTDRSTSKLDTLRFNAEANIPFDFYIPQVLTVGAEYVDDDFTDPASTGQGDESILNNVGIYLPTDRSKMSSRIASAFIENNMKVTDSTDVVLGVRFDDQSKSGSNWSPSLNITQRLGEYFTLKGGIARAYKAPNMYQSAEGYIVNSAGNGCNINDKDIYGTNGCYIMGNGDLKPETSINKELGIQFQKDVVNASLTWFRNDYKDKIASGSTVYARLPTTCTPGVRGCPAEGATYTALYKWDNVPNALIQGLEGSVGLDWGDIRWTNNFTYMMDNKDKSTGNPLSIIPLYTINSIFGYDITDKLDTNFIFTQYGRQKPRQYNDSTGEDLTPEELKSYSISSINFGYKFTSNISGRIGVSNLFDKQLYREKAASGTSTASTYNQPGRAYFASLKYSF
ncbi:MAG: FepA family TonB-dependent siderophore receptor [Acinetobacter populi]|jgi:ferric enterobactin receptor|uniref:FepA family TonB-dependent siderophore receptor n=1 Tax=Acinetobacter populi TaxID=1582270 RepID=UPI0023538F33|nr:FepA family TonB-dependent siderophore receptor [Acinetobacter populi]MCH4248075.1 FepA family TonB-dependent siderophore receptor [Acinetobacter populi]